MKIRFALACASCLVVCAVSSASAQDISAVPTYGTQNLATGFMPDPVAIDLLAGGPNAVSVAGSGSCAGYINNAAPDVDLNYTSGSLPLNIYVKSAADTTLVVNLPDGSWVCNDDSMDGGLNPLVSLTSPQSGNYNIWVGNYNGTETPAAQLNISEMPAQW